MFKIGDSFIEHVERFKYLGHIISNNGMDDDDIKREIRLMFVCTNLLIRKFHRCSLRVKVMLFRAYSMCLYDIALWSRYTLSLIHI